MQLPTYLQIEPVGQCNLRCQMCAIQFRQDGPPFGPPAFMKFDTFTQIIDQFYTLQELHLQGLGEPIQQIWLAKKRVFGVIWRRIPLSAIDKMAEWFSHLDLSASTTGGGRLIVAKKIDINL